MNLPDMFKGLVLDSWYKALLYFGAVAIILSLFFDAKPITNQQLLMIAGGCFLIGLGEWKNHKKESFIKPPNAYTGSAAMITVTVRKPDFIGVLLDFPGIVLIIFSLVSILQLSEVFTTFRQTSTATPLPPQITLTP